ncbi:hypothetical protein NLJ89_g8473 [Agrocybe chaxingu]|uniref:Uncharacterized protein n=1 Tax=Agrocybe chaxingu TaxID=84603 RepID=A0A9W8JUT8_9AGAR|nr:hypothetical protein NLJ89_g8473 [Agrocybe chaxingu]
MRTTSPWVAAPTNTTTRFFGNSLLTSPESPTPPSWPPPPTLLGPQQPLNAGKRRLKVRRKGAMLHQGRRSAKATHIIAGCLDPRGPPSSRLPLKSSADRARPAASQPLLKNTAATSFMCLTTPSSDVEACTFTQPKYTPRSFVPGPLGCTPATTSSSTGSLNMNPRLMRNCDNIDSGVWAFHRLWLGPATVYNSHRDFANLLSHSPWPPQPTHQYPLHLLDPQHRRHVFTRLDPPQP